MNVKQIKPPTEVIVMLDQERRLRYDLNAFAEIEDVYGDVDKLMEDMQKGSIKAVRLMLWAGLIHEDEALTVKQVGKMIDVAALGPLSEIIATTVNSSLPEAEIEGQGSTDPLEG